MMRFFVHLGWLYKLCVLIYRGLHGSKSDYEYLSRRCVRVRDVPGRVHFKSASAGQLLVPIINKKTIGDKGFSFCGPVAWNNLPWHLQSDDCTISWDCFKNTRKRSCTNWPHKNNINIRFNNSDRWQFALMSWLPEIVTSFRLFYWSSENIVHFSKWKWVTIFDKRVGSWH